MQAQIAKKTPHCRRTKTANVNINYAGILLLTQNDDIPAQYCVSDFYGFMNFAVLNVSSRR